MAGIGTGAWSLREAPGGYERHPPEGHFAGRNTELGNQTNFGYVTGLWGRPQGGPRNVQFGVRLGW